MGKIISVQLTREFNDGEYCAEAGIYLKKDSVGDNYCLYFGEDIVSFSEKSIRKNPTGLFDVKEEGLEHVIIVQVHYECSDEYAGGFIKADTIHRALDYYPLPSDVVIKKVSDLTHKLNQTGEKKNEN